MLLFHAGTCCMLVWLPQVQTAVWSQSQLAALLAPAASFAVAAAFAAAPPLWFCIVCPAVLGLAAPLIINVALNQVSYSHACTAWAKHV